MSKRIAIMDEVRDMILKSNMNNEQKKEFRDIILNSGEDSYVLTNEGDTCDITVNLSKLNIDSLLLIYDAIVNL
jgi:hypothetical protein